MAQNKPAGATYQRVETSDAAARNVEMQPVAAQRVQQLQPPPYIGYAVPQPIPPAAFQQMSNNNMIIAAQPTTAALPVTVVEPRLKAKPTIMIVTIVLTVVCLVQQCWPVLVCMTPALIAAMVGYALSDSGSAEQRHTSKAFHAVAICCNVATVVYYVIAFIVLVITLGSIFGVQSSNADYYGGGCYPSSCYYDSDGVYQCPEICYN